VRTLPPLAPLEPLAFEKYAQEKNTLVLDIRSYEPSEASTLQGLTTSTSVATSRLCRMGPSAGFPHSAGH